MSAIIDETVIFNKDVKRIQKQIEECTESIRVVEKDLQQVRHIHELNHQRIDQKHETLQNNIENLSKSMEGMSHVVTELSTAVTKLYNIIEMQQRYLKWVGGVFIWVVTSLLLPFFSESIKNIIGALQ